MLWNADLGAWVGMLAVLLALLLASFMKLGKLINFSFYYYLLFLMDNIHIKSHTVKSPSLFPATCTYY